MGNLKDEIFVINFRGKEISAFSATELAMSLIEGANNFLETKNTKRVEVNIKDQHSFLCHEYLHEYLKHGNNEDFLNKLNLKMSNMQFQFLLYKETSLSPIQRKFVWYQTNYSKIEEAVLFPLSNSISTGKLINLKRCHSIDCQKFFLGKSNKKWCSDNCGGQIRMKRKRIRDSSNKIYLNS